MSAHRFVVEAYDDASGEFVELGQVILTTGAREHEVEHALSAVGVYCPRGADELEWSDGADLPWAIIRDSRGGPLARLWGQP